MPTPSIEPAPEAQTSRLFWRVFVATLVAKLVFAVVLPLTGDEAYFALWGIYPDFGYYDHPPMIGWWLWPLLQIGRTALLVRLPAIFVPLAVGVMLRQALRPLDEAKANLASTVFLLSPLNTLLVVTTTDTPLIFFSALATVFVFRNIASGRWNDALLAGFFLGAAFLSKYFAVLLGVAFVVSYLAFAGARRRWLPLGLIVAGALPGIAINVTWNYEHGWTNLLFNLVNRQDLNGLSWTNPLAFLLVTAFWLGPGILYVLFKSGRELRSEFSRRWAAMRDDKTIVFFIAAVVPGGVFFALSFARNVGIHWLMSFFPFVFAVLFTCLDASQLRRMLRPTGWYATVLALIVVSILALPDSWFTSVSGYESYVLATRPQRVIAAMKATHEADGLLLASDSYVKAAVMEFFTDQRVPVLGRGSYNGRHDDILTDFRALDGRNIFVLGTHVDRLESGKTWFARAELQTMDVDGAHYVVLRGWGFDYAAYRNDVLQRVADRFYRIPRWLTPLMGSSDFLDRYGFGRVEAP